jgi:hypothetical protein
VDKELICIRTFDTRLEAEMMQILLEEHGIPSFVSAEDAGGIRPPPFSFSPGVRLIIRSLDLVPARHVLRNIE